MNFDENTTKIMLELIALITIIVSGALISIKKSKKKKSQNKVSNIKIEGDNNKIVGGNDNSKNK